MGNEAAETAKSCEETPAERGISQRPTWRTPALKVLDIGSGTQTGVGTLTTETATPAWAS